MICVWPAGEERGAVRARADADLARRSGGSPRWRARPGGASRPRSSCGRGPCRSPRPRFDVLLRERVLDAGASPSTVAGPTGNGSFDRLDDALEEQVPLGGLELLRVLLGLGERAQLVLELLAHRRLDRAEPLLLERSGSSASGPGSRAMMSSSVESIVSAGAQLGRRSPRRPQPASRSPLAWIRSPIAWPCAASSSRGELEVEPLRLARLSRGAPPAPRRACRSRPARARAPRAASPRAPRRARPRPSSAPSFVPTTIRSSSSRPPRSRCSVGLTTSSPSIRPMRTAPIGPRNGSGESISAAEAPLMQRMSCADDHVGREDGADHLHLVPEALRPERPDRAVDHARGQDGALGRPPLALEEAAGDLPGRVHPLLDVDGEREEVRAFARLHAALRRCEHHRVARADDDGAVGLLRELAGLERDLAAADVTETVGAALSRQLLMSFPPLSFVRRVEV